MKNIFSISGAFLYLFLSCQSRSVPSFQTDVDSIVRRVVPDRRIGICDLNLIERGGAKLVLRGESMFPAANTEVLKFFTKKGIDIIDSTVLIPDTVHLEKWWGLISLSVANMRSKPGHASEMVSQAIMGTPVRILKDGDGWFLIQTPDRYIGWTNKSAVQPMSYLEILNWRKANRLICRLSEGKIYADPQKKGVISDLVAGAIVIRNSENHGMTQVILPDGRVGYVPGLNWLNFNQWKDSVSLRSERMIVDGKQFLGFPYLWGGTSSKGMDCSGFVKTVCFLNGIILERDASQQIRHGVEVDLSRGFDNLKQGDLLFFGSKQPFRVNHVGIYIGNSELIHESGSVHINSLNKNRANFNSDLCSNIVGARRIIGALPEPGYWTIKMHQWY